MNSWISSSLSRNRRFEIRSVRSTTLKCQLINCKSVNIILRGCIPLLDKVSDSKEPAYLEILNARSPFRRKSLSALSVKQAFLNRKTS